MSTPRCLKDEIPAHRGGAGRGSVNSSGVGGCSGGIGLGFSVTKKPLTTEQQLAIKPIVLSSERYENLLSNAFETDDSRYQKETEEEENFLEYLKKGSDDLVVHFGKNIKKEEEVLVDVAKVRRDAQYAAELEKYHRSKEENEKDRLERIAKVQEFLDKLKPGSRALQRAAMHSEVLRARNVQRDTNAEYERALKQDVTDEIYCPRPPAVPCLTDEERAEARKQRTNKYKLELQETINENTRLRNETRYQILQEQLAERKVVDMKIKEQIEKEKAVVDKKRAMMRQNALEAMIMQEQRRNRDKMTSDVEDRLCCAYNAGKQQLEILKKESINKEQTQRAHFIDINAKNYVSLLQDKEQKESERIRRDISRMQLVFAADEAEKKEKDKAAKQARIEAHLFELKQSKEAERRAHEEKRFEMSERFKNQEVNCLLEQAAKEQRDHNVQEMRSKFKQQLEESMKVGKPDKRADIDSILKGYEREDKFFFEYAKNLIEDAERKGRPLEPFAKVVHEYKQKNKIDCGQKLPLPHMMSQLQIGDNKCKTGKKPVEKALSDDKLQILQDCLKINEILRTTIAKKDEDMIKPCVAVCPVHCLKETKKEEEQQQAKPEESCEQATEKDAAAKRWSKVRNTVHELNYLNQFKD